MEFVYVIICESLQPVRITVDAAYLFRRGKERIVKYLELGQVLRANIELIMVRKIKAAPETIVRKEVDEDNNKVIQWQFIENTEHVLESASENFGSKMEKLGMLYRHK
jgi:hypothetical protein